VRDAGLGHKGGRGRGVMARARGRGLAVGLELKVGKWACWLGIAHDEGWRLAEGWDGHRFGQGADRDDCTRDGRPCKGDQIALAPSGAWLGRCQCGRGGLAAWGCEHGGCEDGGC
jgi:hypothetical protein